MIAKVEPLTPARALRGPFDYRIPAGMEGVEVGTMLEVPFGKRRLLGVVVDMATESDLAPDRLVEPLRALEHGVPPDLVQLGLWVADSYCSTPARGLALVLPPGTGNVSTQQKARTRRVLVAELTATGWSALDPAASERLTPKQNATLESLRDGAVAAAQLDADHGSLRRLANRGLLTLELREQRREVAAIDRGGQPAGELPDVELTPAQAEALAGIESALDTRSRRSLLLYGVTGSGKTEVYLRAVARTLEQGRSAIVMVPEIALTPQTARRFEQRFGNQVAVMHSKLSLGERYDEWRRLRDGQARVCVGPRSAVFAPLVDLGLIVIDEEHDSAYKQESDPRYDARQVAAQRAKLSGAVLVAGSATPRPESWVAMERIELPDRVDGLGMPPVELVDMRGLRHALHPQVRAELEQVRERGAKAIVLVNRRGWSPFLDCGDCGRAWVCPRCEVSLVLHRSERGQHLLCHHCGHTEATPDACPDCGSTSVARHGTGTQKLEAELKQALAPMPIFRLDADAARRKHGIAATLDEFSRSKSGVLIGTQMVAQGHDFPEVELAIVQDADATLRFPDFRSEERTFSLVAQVAGRSGRGRNGGVVLVQTLNPGASCLRFAARHDAAGFLTEELQRREMLTYPPYSRLIKVLTNGDSQEAADLASERAASLLRLDGIEVLGPAPLFKLKDRFRSVLLMKVSPERVREVVEAVGKVVHEVASDREHKGIKLAVDVDPQ